MSVRIGVGASSHPVPSAGARLAARRAREELAGASADLVLVFVSGAHLDVAIETVELVRAELRPRALAGSCGVAVLGEGTQLPGPSSIVVWAADLGGGVADVHHVGAERPLPSLAGVSALLLLPDSFSFPIRRRLPELTAAANGAPVVGGCASGRLGDGRTVLVADGVVTGGMVCVALRGVEVLPLVAEGQVPIGPELIVSAADRHVVHELGGRPAADALQEALDRLRPEERRLLDGGVNIGLIDDGGSASWSTRKIVGADEQTGTIAIAGAVDPGQRVRLLANSKAAAEGALRDGLELCDAALGGRPPAGALVFACTSRDQGFFGAPGHDAAIVAEAFPGAPVAGMVSRGEIGPVDGAARLLGLTTTVVLLPG